MQWKVLAQLHLLRPPAGAIRDLRHYKRVVVDKSLYHSLTSDPVFISILSPEE